MRKAPRRAPPPPRQRGSDGMATPGAEPARLPRMRARVPGLLIVLALTAVTVVLAHELMFVLTYGDRAPVELARTGHDQRWTDAVLVVLSLGGTLAIAAAWRLWRLARTLQRLEARGGRVSAAAGAACGPTSWALWRVLAPGAALVLVVQENLEHLWAGAPLPGLGVLASPEYPITLPVVALVALALAVVAALFRVRFAVLRARIAATRAAGRVHSVVRTPRAAVVPRPAASLIGRRLAGRAPPLLPV
jgi:hypothetical protein